NEIRNDKENKLKKSKKVKTTKTMSSKNRVIHGI
ncbi:hypothetical protein M8044_000545, partial [Columbia Basin potato purple top phytoplasma]|nr:hypothetical protein [Columbia Basin potato purple top phytoplasma]